MKPADARSRSSRGPPCQAVRAAAGWILMDNDCSGEFASPALVHCHLYFVYNLLVFNKCGSAGRFAG